MQGNGGRDGVPLLSGSETEDNGVDAGSGLIELGADSPFATPVDSEIAESVDHWKYEQAAIYLEEGVDHSKFADHPKTAEAVVAYRYVNSWQVKVIDLLAGIVLMALALFEEPAVCNKCSNFNATAIVEILCLLASHVHTFFYFRWKGASVFKEKKLVVKIALTIEMLIEAVVILARQETHLRFMRAFRPVFIIDNKFATGIKRVLYEILQSLPPVIEILVLLITFITTFAVMGYYLFGTQKMDAYTQDSHNWYFYSFQDSWVNLFVLLTTANYPDVMMPAYRDNRWAALFFIIYLMVALYFIANLLLAAVYSNFNSKEKEKFGRLFIHRRHGLRKAFHVLDTENTGKLDYLTFRGVVMEYLPRKHQFEITCMFKAMDKEETGGVDLDNWFSFYEISLYTWREDRGQSSGLFCAIQDYPAPILPFFLVLNKVVLHIYFEYFIDFCIIVNAAFLIAEAALTTDANKEQHAIVDYEQVFISIYTVEAVMKICGLGFRGYFSKGFNIFDFVIVAVSLLGQAIESRTIYVTILRPFRLFRLFKLRKSFNQILSAMFNIIPRLVRFVMALICVYYFFSILGMSAFAGDISTCGCARYKGQYQCSAELFQANETARFYPNASSIETLPCISANNCTRKVCGGHYSGYYDRSSADGLYYLNNFDDIVSSYVVLFELMVVNNWHVTMQGAVSSTSSQTTATRAYFILFYLVAVIIVTNVVVAFILDAFQSLLPTLQAKEERAEERRKRHAEQGMAAGALMEDDDDSDDLTKTVYIQRAVAESLDDPKFVAKVKKGGKVNHTAEIRLHGRRRIQPIDIYLLIFGSDIDEWKTKEMKMVEEEESRPRSPTMSDAFPHGGASMAENHELATPHSDGIKISGKGTRHRSVVSYTAPEYIPMSSSASSSTATATGEPAALASTELAEEPGTDASST